MALVAWLELEGLQAGGPEALCARAALASKTGAGTGPGVLCIRASLAEQLELWQAWAGAFSTSGLPW